MAVLKSVKFLGTTIGDSLDHDSAIEIVIYRESPHIEWVHTRGIPTLLNDNNFTMGCNIVGQPTNDDIRGTKAVVGIHPNGHDKWDCSIQLVLYFGEPGNQDPNSWHQFVTTFIGNKLGNHDGYPQYISAYTQA